MYLLSFFKSRCFYIHIFTWTLDFHSSNQIPSSQHYCTRIAGLALLYQIVFFEKVRFNTKNIYIWKFNNFAQKKILFHKFFKFHSCASTFSPTCVNFNYFHEFMTACPFTPEVLALILFRKKINNFHMFVAACIFKTLII
jgi:hypothetical protein